jgi:hypothetical protein
LGQDFSVQRCQLAIPYVSSRLFRPMSIRPQWVADLLVVLR